MNESLIEFRSLLVELARWSRVAERNGDLHARIASALALADEQLGPDTSAAAPAVGERQGRQPAQDLATKLGDVAEAYHYGDDPTLQKLLKDHWRGDE